MRLYDKYKKLKEKNNINKYLFKSGNFYIFLDEDAKEVSKVTVLKLISFGSTVKCGFPINSLDKYLEILKNIGLEVVVVERCDDIIVDLKNIDLKSLSNKELISIVERFVNSV